MNKAMIRLLDWTVEHNVPGWLIGPAYSLFFLSLFMLLIELAGVPVWALVPAAFGILWWTSRWTSQA